jgi:hypothetical protein
MKDVPSYLPQMTLAKRKRRNPFSYATIPDFAKSWFAICFGSLPSGAMSLMGLFLDGKGSDANRFRMPEVMEHEKLL